MKKNTKKRRTIRRLLIATAFALLMIPASVSADVVGLHFFLGDGFFARGIDRNLIRVKK